MVKRKSKHAEFDWDFMLKLYEAKLERQYPRMLTVGSNQNRQPASHSIVDSNPRRARRKPTARKP